VQRGRCTRRQQIERFFAENLGRGFPSPQMHARFGSAFRTRVSEINRDPGSGIEIVNQVGMNDRSVYWARVRQRGPRQLELRA
jgi:hypothetical protein